MAPAPAPLDLNLPSARRIPEVKVSDLYCSGFVTTSEISNDLNVLAKFPGAVSMLVGETEYVYLSQGASGGVTPGEIFTVVRPTRPVRSTREGIGNLGLHYLEVGQLQAVLVHHVALLTDLGISKLTAAFFFSVVSFGRMGGQLVWGSVSDRLLRETTYTLSSLCFMLGIVSLMFLDAPPAFVLIYGYTILFGFGSGGMSPITSAMAADLFRGRNFGAIFGTLNMGFQLGAGAGAWLSGVVFDAFNSYQLAFVLAVAAIVMSCSSAWIAAPRRIRKTLVGRLRIG